MKPRRGASSSCQPRPASRDPAGAASDRRRRHGQQQPRAPPPAAASSCEKPPLTQHAGRRHARPRRPPPRCTIATENVAPPGSPRAGERKARRRRHRAGFARRRTPAATGEGGRRGCGVGGLGFPPRGRTGATKERVGNNSSNEILTHALLYAAITSPWIRFDLNRLTRTFAKERKIVLAPQLRSWDYRLEPRWRYSLSFREF
jgi:hypothetical protein